MVESIDDEESNDLVILEEIGDDCTSDISNIRSSSDDETESLRDFIVKDDMSSNRYNSNIINNNMALSSRVCTDSQQTIVNEESDCDNPLLDSELSTQATLVEDDNIATPKKKCG